MLYKNALFGILSKGHLSQCWAVEICGKELTGCEGLWEWFPVKAVVIR